MCICRLWCLQRNMSMHAYAPAADLCCAMQLVSYGFAEKYNSGGIIGVLASDKVQLGDIAIGNASLGLVTEASVDLMGASCAGVLVRPYL